MKCDHCGKDHENAILERFQKYLAQVTLGQTVSPEHVSNLRRTYLAGWHDCFFVTSQISQHENGEDFSAMLLNGLMAHLRQAMVTEIKDPVLRAALHQKLTEVFHIRDVRPPCSHN